MKRKLNNIASILQPFSVGQIFYGVFPADSTTVDHAVLVPINTSTVTETDNGRYWLQHRVEIDIFSLNSAVYDKVSNISNALEDNGYNVENVAYYMDDATKLYQIMITVSSCNYAR